MDQLYSVLSTGNTAVVSQMSVPSLFVGQSWVGSVSYLAHELLVGVDVQAAVEGAAFQLVQQDVFPSQERSTLALARMTKEGGGRTLSSGRPAEGGTEGRGESAGRYHSFVYGDLAQGLVRSGQGHGGHHALARDSGQAARQAHLHWLHSPRQDGLYGGVGREGGKAGRVG